MGQFYFYNRRRVIVMIRLRTTATTTTTRDFNLQERKRRRLYKPQQQNWRIIILNKGLLNHISITVRIVYTPHTLTHSLTSASCVVQRILCWIRFISFLFFYSLDVNQWENKKTFNFISLKRNSIEYKKRRRLVLLVMRWFGVVESVSLRHCHQHTNTHTPFWLPHLISFYVFSFSSSTPSPPPPPYF